VLVAFSGNVAKVRQLAIDETYQGRGIGTEIMKRAEQAILARNIRTVMLHGRVTARGFFERLGYAARSGVFTEVTIPHIAMQKRPYRRLNMLIRLYFNDPQGKW